MTYSTAVVGYMYRADLYTPAGIIEAGIQEGWLAPAARGMSAEDALDQAQHTFGIDREDEYSFDSDDFPKVVLDQHVDEGDVFQDEHGAYVKLDA